jgi:WD40 repeat protein/tRNA A-37 threonylcarbamoyl transferase component Bud32
MVDTDETSDMTPSNSTDSLRQGLLEEVLEDYMRRHDRGEAVDRDRFLAQHPELADELRSYFAGSDEVERLHRRPGRETPMLSPSCGLPALGESRPGSSEARRIGEYELLEQIGYGGMGVIYKARQLRLERLVALKMIRSDRLASPVDILRFRSEAEAVACLDHPNIAPIYEIGEHEGEHYFSMKLIEGGSLAQHLPRLSADVPSGVNLLIIVARAVHYAHQRGLLHRDLKPANILLDAENRPYITDFGLAKRLSPQPVEASLTQQGLIVGTPSYMAPEQASNQVAVSTAADVYSLGAILYELLTGRPPFRGSTPLDTLVQVREQEPVAPRRFNKRLDRDLETICLKCLHKETHERYPSAAALADDLERWLRGEPLRARPIGSCRRALKWVRRQPVLAAVFALLVIVFWAGFAGVIWQWRHAVDSTKAEQRTAYTRAIGQAYAEWRDGNTSSAERVLSECRAELRGWEWHYLRRLFRVRQLATLRGHEKAVLAVAFSPDGSRMVSAGADGIVSIWDRQSLRAILTLHGHAAAITVMAFSPDGRRFASGSADGSVRIWDTTSGEAMVTWQCHAGTVSGLAFDPTGRQLASTGGVKAAWGELKLWDSANGKTLASQTWKSFLTAVAFSPDGQQLVAASHDGFVFAWEAANVNQPPVFFPVQNERIIPWTSVAFSGDGQRVAAGSSAGVVRMWAKVKQKPKTQEGDPLRNPVGSLNEWAGVKAQEFLTLAQAAVSGVVFSGRDGRILAAACSDNTIQGWYSGSGKPAFTLRGHQGAIASVASSPDGVCLLSGSQDRTLKLWDIRRRDDDLTLRASEGYTSIAFSPSGMQLASAPRDKAVLIWDINTGKAVVRLRSLPESVNGLAFSAGGVQLASAGDDGVIRVREVPSGRETLNLRGHSGPVHAVAFGPVGDRLASAGEDGMVRVWDIALGRETFLLKGHDAAVHAVAFSPDGSRVASAGADGVVRVWDAGTGQQRLALVDHEGPVYAVAFHPDGRCLAAAGQDEVVHVWDAATGELVRKLRGHTGPVRGLAYNPQGRLASAGDDMAVRLWDSDGHELLALRGHTREIRAVAFSRDGERLASASDDLTIKVWDGTPLEETSAGQK